MKRLLLTMLLLPIFAYAGEGPASDPLSKYYQPGVLFNQKAVFSDPQLHDILEAKGYSEAQLDALNALSTPANQGLRWLCFQRKNPHYTVLSDMENGQDPLTRPIESEFYKQRKIMFRKAIKQELIASLFMPTLLIGTAAGTHAMQISNDLLDALLGTNAIMIFGYSGIGLRSLVAAYFSPHNDPFLPFELEYARRKFELNFLNQGNLTGDQRIPLYHEQKFLEARRSSNAREALNFFDILLKVPTQSRQPMWCVATLREKLSLYSEAAQGVILGACANHCAAYKSTLGENLQSREFVTLISKPGTGKSTCVQKIADAMGLPCVTVNLSGASRDSLFGSKNTPGIFLEKLIELGTRNGMFLFDELNRVMENQDLLAAVLDFLEPNVKRFRSPYLELDIDVSHLLCFVACNNAFTDDAIKSRFNVLKTADLAIHNKEQLLDKVMGKYLDDKLQGKTLTEEIRLQWHAQIADHIGDDNLNFRDAQAKLDALLGAHRITMPA